MQVSKQKIHFQSFKIQIIKLTVFSKLFLSIVRKKNQVIENFSQFEAEGLRSLEQFIQTDKGQYNFSKRMLL